MEILTPVVSVQDSASPILQRMKGVITGEQGTKAIGQAIAQLFKRHLIKKNAEPNKMGFPKTNFYGLASEKVHFRANSNSVSVNVSQEGIAQRFYGGTIKPVNQKALTIPVHPKAYGHRAREFELKVVNFKVGKSVAGMLVRSIPGKAFGEVYYLLVKSVTQNADPSVLPDKDTVINTAVQALERRVDRELRRS